MQCNNHIKQLSLAVHNYLDTYEALPPAGGQGSRMGSNSGWAWSSRGWSTIFFLCPYIEQVQAYETVMNYVPGVNSWDYPTEPLGHHWGWFTQNPWRLEHQISMFRCPSDSNKNTRDGVMNTNYMSSRGDNIYWNGECFGVVDPANLNSFTVTDANQLLCRRRAPFAGVHWHPLAALSDGTSNTVLFSEAVVAGSTEERNIRGTIAESVDPSPDLHPLTSCALNLLSDDNRTIKPGIQVRDYRGFHATDARAAITGFTTVMAPNTPACLASQAFWEGGFGIFSPTSNHPGGVNCGVADGSVRFVSDTIDCGDLTKIQAEYGGSPTDSPYGVWGAFGSIAGSESKPTP
jgi:hypothetical protein